MSSIFGICKKSNKWALIMERSSQVVWQTSEKSPSGQEGETRRTLNYPRTKASAELNTTDPTPPHIFRSKKIFILSISTLIILAIGVVLCENNYFGNVFGVLNNSNNVLMNQCQLEFGDCIVTDLATNTTNITNATNIPRATGVANTSSTPAIISNSTETGVELRKLNVIEYDLSAVSPAITVTTIGIENKNIIENGSLLIQTEQTPYPTTTTTINFNTTGVVSREFENLGCDLCAALTAPARVTTIVMDNENKFEYESESNRQDTRITNENKTIFDGGSLSPITINTNHATFYFDPSDVTLREFNNFNNVYGVELNENEMNNVEQKNYDAWVDNHRQSSLPPITTRTANPTDQLHDTGKPRARTIAFQTTKTKKNKNNDIAAIPKNRSHSRGMISWYVLW